ncbi:MAG: hypothetical protein KGH69_00285 [Candidatus Micrarchaeota archaeon]|nr:hypothetical protein [Candidatus Micrarchaeota archaeon]
MLQLGVMLLQTNALTYVSAGSIFVEGTIGVTLTMLTVLAISIQIARGYFLRILRKFTLRLAADIWWLLFVILRDASIFLVVFLGVMLFWPGIYQDIAIAVPFQPIAIDMFAIALVILLLKDTDEEPFYNSLITIFVLIGTVLYTTGTVFVTESAVQLAVLPPTVSDSSSNIWGFFNNNFNSINNPALSMYTFYVGFAILGLCGLIAIISSFKGGIFNRFVEPKPKPIVKETPEPQRKGPDKGS